MSSLLIKNKGEKKTLKKFPEFLHKRLYRQWSAPRDLEPRKQNGNAKERKFVIAWSKSWFFLHVEGGNLDSYSQNILLSLSKVLTLDTKYNPPPASMELWSGAYFSCLLAHVFGPYMVLCKTTTCSFFIQQKNLTMFCIILSFAWIIFVLRLIRLFEI